MRQSRAGFLKCAAIALLVAAVSGVAADENRRFQVLFDIDTIKLVAPRYPEELLKAMRDAGIIAYTHPLVAPPAPPGVIIFGTEDDPASQALKSALDRADVQFKLAPRNGPARLSIGSKLAPF